jgi:uncharacterized membrane protein (UPF0127 family)
MQQLIITNINNKEILADQCYHANTFLTRLKGLLGKKQMAPGEGLLISPCSSVHTLGMKIDIDVIFLSADHEILHIIERMRPGKLSPIIKKSHSVLELPAGQIRRTNTHVGHYLNVSQVSR